MFHVRGYALSALKVGAQQLKLELVCPYLPCGVIWIRKIENVSIERQLK